MASSSSMSGRTAAGGPLNDPSFERWIRKKELLERGLELFHRLDEERSENEDKWKGVAMALQAIKWYYMLTVPKEESGGGLVETLLAEPKDEMMGSRTKVSYKGAKTIGPNSLFEAFRRWTLEHYTFFMVKLSPAELAGFSNGAKELFMKDEEGDGSVSLMPSLKYAVQKKPDKKDEKVRPLTKDQKLGNAIFLRLLKEAWNDARKQLEAEVEASITGVPYMAGKGKGKENESEGKDGENDAKPAEGKGEAGGKEEQPARATQPPRDDGKSEAKRRMAEIYRRGLPAFNTWIEEDEDAKIEKKREEDKEKEKEARKLYEGFVRRKDETRIRLPTNLAPDAKVVSAASRSSRFDFSVGKGVVRPKADKPYSTTVDIMMGSGLKYVHALKRGTGAMQGDLEKCRQQLLNAGFVCKENFDRDDVDKYEEEKRANAVIQKKKEAAEKRKEATDRAFSEWLQTKDASDTAVKYLAAVTPPNPDADGPRNAEAHWLEVGRALKGVDATLYKQWATWAKDYKGASGGTCVGLWDAFSPQACDVHCKISTGVKDIFLKLLRPGLNYRRAFSDHVDKVWRRMLHEDPNLESEVRYDSNPKEAEDRKKRELMDNMSLDKKEMRRLLTSMGIVMADDQLRRLIDAFDKNGDGVVSMQEFIDFVGEERGVMGGDKAATLQHKCVWATTCNKCGMPAAYTISIMSSGKGKWRKDEEKKDDDDYADDSDKQEEKGGEVVVKLNTGEHKRRLEMPEHCRRVDTLRKFGFDHDADDEAKEREYEDDFDQHDDDEPAKGGSSAGKRCEACTWTMADRTKALAVLARLSSENRQNLALQKVLATGSPPPPPKLTAAKLGHRDVGSSPTALTTELLLHWKPPSDGGLVAFVVLEQQVTVVQPPSEKGGAARVAVQYVEVARDPTDAEQDAAYALWVRELKPNCQYSFRVRAFNGFGAGPWAHHVFHTRPLPPPAPLARRCTPTSVTLTWRNDEGYEKRLAQLKKLFERADSDGSGHVSREELLAVIRNKEPQLMTFLKKMCIAEGVSVFDAIELDDNETLSWEEFRRFFDDNEGLDEDGASVASASKAGDSTRTVAPTAKTRYVVQRCESHADKEEESQYRDVYKCSGTQATIRDLRPGIMYRFRVCAVNGDNLSGAFSPPVVVTTMLETPTAPRLATSTRSQPPPSCLKIIWDGTTRAGGGILHRDKLKGQLDKTLADWAKTGIPTAAGVNVEAIFNSYDKNGDGTIDVEELDKLLIDLGVTPTEEKKREALDSLDVDDDGHVSFQEFRAWWEGDDISYVLKRSDGIPGQAYTSKAPTAGLELKTVCFRGPETATEVAGLVPNCVYEFRLRISNPRAASLLSPPLLTMTPPNAPDAPSLTRVEAKEAILRWYAPAHGAHKYILQQRAAESSDNLDRLRTLATQNTSSANNGEEDWTTVYEGQRTMAHVTDLGLNSVYRFRVIAVNAQDGRSNPSPATQVTTVPRPNRVPLKPLTASECFPIDCTNDVVEGDTILFTERLYRNDDGELIDNAKAKLSTPGALASPGGAMTPRLQMTAFSVGSVGSARSRAHGEFVGERTVAAHVWRISDYAGRKNGAAATVTNSATGTPPVTVSATALLRGSFDKTGATNVWGKKSKRVFRMEVVWSTVSRACDELLLSKGAIIERLEDRVFQFETFRAPWEHEKGRRGADAEASIAAKATATVASAKPN